MVEEIMKLPEENGNEVEVKVDNTHKPEDIAAAFFKMQKIKFEGLISKLAPYQLRRAIMNVVSYPFTDKEYLPETEEEKQFAYLAHEMMLNKVMMVAAGEMMALDKAQQ